MSYTINKYHGNYNRSWRNDTIKYIVVHYVGSGTSAAGCAKNNCIYFSGGNRNASADYFIDDGGIWEYNDPSQGYYCWSVGDGYGKYGITNSNSISIEVCMNGDNPFTATEINYLTWLVQHLMEKFNVPASRVVRHYDASRKACPRYYANRQAEWDKLHAVITGQAPADNAPAPTPVPSKPVVEKLDVDGVFGSKTILALQRALNAPYKDGVISRQQVANKKYLAACTTGWEFGTGFAQGSQTIELLQKKIGAEVDGVIGKNTVKALQKYLGTYVDGYLDNPSPCVKELQRRLNAGTF